MSRENVELVRRGYSLFAAGDYEGVAALMSTEAKLPDGGGLGLAGTAAGTRYGPEGFLRGSEDVLEAFEDYQVEPEDYIAVGEAVVVPVRISGRGKASGARLDTRVAHLWLVRDGKAVHNEIHRTTEEAIEAARSLQHDARSGS